MPFLLNSCRLLFYIQICTCKLAFPLLFRLASLFHTLHLQGYFAKVVHLKLEINTQHQETKEGMISRKYTLRLFKNTRNLIFCGVEN